VTTVSWSQVVEQFTQALFVKIIATGARKKYFIIIMW